MDDYLSLCFQLRKKEREKKRKKKNRKVVKCFTNVSRTLVSLSTLSALIEATQTAFFSDEYKSRIKVGLIFHVEFHNNIYIL